jgi:hypothetical protein
VIHLTVHRNKMKNTSKALSTLKRNFYGTIILGFLLPVIASEILETASKAAAIVGGALILLSIINLSYAKKVEEAMNEDLIETSRLPSKRNVNQSA